MYLKDKTILVIGASGTLGNAIITELLKHDVHSIRAYSRNEYRLFLLRQNFKEYEDKMRYYVGDIREKDRLNLAFQRAHIVINCAALKRVEVCQESPFECMQTNIVGVQNALECAIKNNVEVFVQISTDKAVLPVNIYGYSKAFAEGLVLNANRWQGDNRTRFLIVRSGNILNSSGSVVEIWREQQKQGLPLTVTDLNAVRYMASKESIAKAILKTITEGHSGLVVLNMPCYKVSDLLKDFEGCKVNITGLSKGEKMKESLWREGENFKTVEVE
jgi:FlaA1/EpsC-like NDP-sugar epimerase